MNPQAPQKKSSATTSQPDKPWWRHPMVWLVIGGPLVVVVASVITAVIAIRGADPVLDRSTDGTGTAAATSRGDMTPAVQARNHAATPKP